MKRFPTALLMAFLLTLGIGRATYDPTVGRWMSRDPLGEQVGPNLYQYVYNNPINLIDPLGHDPRGTAPSLNDYASTLIENGTPLPGSVLQLQQAGAIGESGLNARTQQLEYLSSGNTAAAAQIAAQLKVYGVNGQSLGLNPFVDAWEHTPEAHQLAVQKAAALAAAFFSSKQTIESIIAKYEAKRQQSLINYVNGIISKGMANTCPP